MFKKKPVQIYISGLDFNEMDDSFIKIYKFVFHKTTTFIKILKFVFHNTTHEWNQTKLRFRMQFFCDVKKEGMDICKSRNIYFHGVFFFHMKYSD